MKLFGKVLKKREPSILDKMRMERVPPHLSQLSDQSDQHRNRSERMLIDDFLWFQPYMNYLLPEGWAVEDTGKTMCSIGTIDQPDYGREYQLRFGAAVMGRMEVVCGPNMFSIGDVRPKAREATLSVRLAHLEYMLFEEAHAFLFQCARALQSAEDMEAANRIAKAEATHAMTSFLWERMQVQATCGSANGVLSWSCTGPYGVYLRYVDHWKGRGVDPLKEWNGDRP